jgi:hypothetical protein
MLSRGSAWRVWDYMKAAEANGMPIGTVIK